MDVRPRLKAVAVQSMEGQVVLRQRALQRIYLDDSSGSIAAILRLLDTGAYLAADLRQAMADRGFTVTAQEVSAVLQARPHRDQDRPATILTVWRTETGTAR